jgi:hypothetical protein
MASAQRGVSLLREDGRPTSAGLAELVATTIRKLPGLTVSTGITHDPRKETVIYAAPGFETRAASISQALQGARVEALTWAANADIVVACVGL